MPAYNIFFFSALFFLFGILFASLNLKFWILIITAILVCGFIVLGLLFKKSRYFWLASLAPLILLGAFYYTWDDLKFRNQDVVFDKELEFSGIIFNNPVIKNNTQEFYLKLAEPFQAKLLIKTQLYPQFVYGDELKLKSIISKPFEGGYARYLEKERVIGIVSFPEIEKTGSGKASLIKSRLFDFRNKITGSFKKILGVKEASFLTGLTLGGTSELPKEFKEAMSRSGTTHLVALSGYNISVIVWAVMGIFLYFLSRRTSFILSILVILGFVLMTGAEASVVRASIMAFLVLLAREVGRIYDFRNAIIFAGLLMVLSNPKVLAFDVGFQLSFMALLGIIYLRPAFQKLFKIDEPGFFSWKDNLLTTFSAQLLVAPILIANFGQLSLVSLIANVVILELIPVTMGLGFLLAGAAFISYQLSLVFGWVIAPLLRIEIFSIETFSKFSFPLSPALSFGVVFVYYVFIIAFIFYVRKFVSEIKRT